METLAQLINELDNRIADQALVNPAISKGSVGWHIEHCLLTINLVVGALKQSAPADYKPTFDLRRNFVLLTGRIPRGKVKAPKVVRPAVAFDRHTLQQHALLAKENIKGVDELQAGHYFTHPFLGDFKLKPALKFLKIHTRHHIKIINDIIKNR